jgi:NAD(P)-dependent dehydrogenase (short-subunit alcohol dehydrogenase family)
MSKTIIVTGASQGIGAGVTKGFIDRGGNVVASARKITESALAPGEKLALVDGNIGEASTAAKIAAAAITRFGSIDGLVNNAGFFLSKRFAEHITDDFEQLSETNLLGCIHVMQLAVKRMLFTESGGSVTGITSAMVEHPSPEYPPL